MRLMVLSLGVSICPAVALLALLVIATARGRCCRCCLEVGRLDLLLIRIGGLLPLLVRVVDVVRHPNVTDGL